MAKDCWLFIHLRSWLIFWYHWVRPYYFIIKPGWTITISIVVLSIQEDPLTTPTKSHPGSLLFRPTCLRPIFYPPSRLHLIPESSATLTTRCSSTKPITTTRHHTKCRPTYQTVAFSWKKASPMSLRQKEATTRKCQFQRRKWLIQWWMQLQHQRSPKLSKFNPAMMICRECQ